MKKINSRRNFIKTIAIAATASMVSCKAMTTSKYNKAKVVVVGGGFSGATLVKYLRMWSNFALNVTLIEPNDNFVSCPFSNLVIAGFRNIKDITHSYSAIKNKYGVNIVKDKVSDVDFAQKKVKTLSGQIISYDKLVFSTGIDFDYNNLGSLSSSEMQNQIMHSWKAGNQTTKLANQIQSMKDGEVFGISIPKSPYRCPPGPYERISLIADYFKKQKPKSKVIVLDANEKIQSKGAIFSKAWKQLYPGIIEYNTNAELIDVIVQGKKVTAITDFDQIKLDVLNAIPNQTAAQIVLKSGLKLINKKWAEVKWLDFESTNIHDVHISGDSLFPAPGMPKSGTMANQHAKVIAAALLDKIAGREINQNPVVMNTCYSFVASDSVVHVASVHQYNAEKQQLLKVKGAGGLSKARNQLEVSHANAWAENIWSDIFS